MKIRQMRKELTIRLNGKRINHYRDLIRAMEKKLLFPRSCEGNIDRYFDWIRDLSWLKASKITFVIRHYSAFAAANKADAEQVVCDFEEVIIPFWRDEAVKCIVDGRPKEIVFIIEP